MALHILKCLECGDYSLQEKCPKCGGKSVQPLPAKYSPEDQYGKYRREAKRESLKQDGLLK
ncbi:RNA-protein complex protein Nop10 [Candidatus Woesearchaeota archaeon]|nr:RNA-protein complex protein Nop10 [Candidatus Woesearchaeota archaeon]